LSLPGIHNLRIPRGVDLSRSWQWKPGGVAADLTGYQATAYGTHGNSQGTKIWEILNAAITMDASGNITITMSDTATAALTASDAGFWYLDLTNTAGDGTKYRVLEGNYEVTG
jgi:hypothetical protein